MRVSMKLFAKERKQIKRIAHEKHVRYYDNPSFLEVFNDRLYPIMEPVFEAMGQTTTRYHVDVLHDYDFIKKYLSGEVEENSLIHVIGIRDCGVDGADDVEAMYEAETEFEFRTRYSHIFWFFACIDTDPYSGEPVRYIDVYCLKQKAL